MSTTFLNGYAKKTMYVEGNQRQLNFAFSVYIFVVFSSVKFFVRVSYVKRCKIQTGKTLNQIETLNWLLNKGNKLTN